MTSCPQVVPSLSPELSYSTDAPNEQQLKELLDSLTQDVFPAGTDVCDLYTNDWYNNAPRLANGMYNEPYPKSTLTTAGDNTLAAQTNLQAHCSFHCDGIERLPNVGEWSTLLRDDLKSMQSGVPSQDPRNWTVEHVQDWLFRAARDHQLGSIDYNLFAMNGARLCDLSLADFNQRAPLAGEILYTLLCSLKKDRVQSCSVWYPKEAAAPKSPCSGEATLDRSSDCSSTGSSYFDERDRHRMSSSPPVTATPLLNYSVSDAHCLASGASHLPSPYNTVNYTPLTGIAQTLPVCDTLPYPAGPGFTTINPFPRRTPYKSVKDAPPTHLRTFLKELLSNRMFAYCIEWADESQGIFRILNSEEVARFWGNRKNRPKMNYDKLSRSLRFYYKKGLLRKVPGQRLVYQFTEPNANTATEDNKKETTTKESKSNKDSK